MEKLKDLLTHYQLETFKSQLHEDEVDSYLCEHQSLEQAEISAIRNVSYWMNMDLKRYQSFWDERYAPISILLNGLTFDYHYEVQYLLSSDFQTTVSKIDILTIIEEKYHLYIDYIYMSVIKYFSDTDSLIDFINPLIQQIDLAQSTVHKKNT
ncbi:hypothetical protein [Carnobacterium maltaromaticum]|uniref:hypothetical protein n=1 Tax=Carnobacterium maltaromaticum TaxID=2751 RepID=UPI00191BB818|nr:hypothetical protein [Carnobacterium maltaromaticum]CAD5903009.1 hypothetical protein CMALT394_60031 [Carnobacterium maltaromaticum]